FAKAADIFFGTGRRLGKTDSARAERNQTVCRSAPAARTPDATPIAHPVPGRPNRGGKHLRPHSGELSHPGAFGGGRDGHRLPCGAHPFAPRSGDQDTPANPSRLFLSP